MRCRDLDGDGVLLAFTGFADPFPALAWSTYRVIDPNAPRRTLASAAAVESFFAFIWFGWGQEGPPPVVSLMLGAGAVLALLVVIGGIVAVLRSRDEPSPITGAAVGKHFGMIVGIEFTLVGLGATILGLTGHSGFIAAWTALVVGVHFLPLARIFVGIGMLPLAVAVSLAGIGAFIVGAVTEARPSTVAGLGAGVALLAHATSMLVATRQDRP